MKRSSRWLLSILGMGSCAFAQTTGPTRDVNGNMVGEVELLRYVLQPNTQVNLGGYKDYIVWGGPYPGCFDPVNPGKSNHTAYYTAKKISTRIGMGTIQHCHGTGGITSEGLKPVGTAAFTWNDGQLHPKTASASKMGFYADHYVRHYIPVVSGQKVSVKMWLATAAPSWASSPRTAFRIDYYPGWSGNSPQPDNPSKTNNYEFAWDNNTTIADHVYTLNFTPPFTGTIAIDAGPDLVSSTTYWGALWLKAMTLQDGRSDGIVPVGSYTPAKFEPRYHIKFRNSGLVMVPDFGSGYAESDSTAMPGETVKQRVLNPNDINQQWYLHPSTTPGYYNIWTKHGALTSGPYWWEARSLTKPNLGKAWQQIQFVDLGNGYKRMKLGGKGPAGEDLFLTSYDNVDGSNVAVYFGGLAGQEVQVTQAVGPVPGVRYKVQYAHSNKCLAVSGASTANGAALVQQTCTGANHQLVTLGSLSGGYYSMAFVHSGKLADINGAGTADGAQAIQWQSNGGNNQQFTLYAHNDGTYSFAYRHSGKCLDINGASTSDGAQAIQWTCHWANNQRFRFVP